MKANIAKHVEFCEIYLEFSDEFQLEDIPDKYIVKFLTNVENKLLGIGRE